MAARAAQRQENVRLAHSMVSNPRLTPKTACGMRGCLFERSSASSLTTTKSPQHSLRRLAKHSSRGRISLSWTTRTALSTLLLHFDQLTRPTLTLLRYIGCYALSICCSPIHIARSCAIPGIHVQAGDRGGSNAPCLFPQRVECFECVIEMERIHQRVSFQHFRRCDGVSNVTIPQDPIAQPFVQDRFPQSKCFEIKFVQTATCEQRSFR